MPPALSSGARLLAWLLGLLRDAGTAAAAVIRTETAACTHESHRRNRGDVSSADEPSAVQI